MKGNCGECERRWFCDINPDECDAWPDPVPMTNADHIRSMTDEELAEWLKNGVSSDGCDYCDFNEGYCDGSHCKGKDDAEIVLDWLKRPYKEDT